MGRLAVAAVEVQEALIETAGRIKQIARSQIERWTWREQGSENDDPVLAMLAKSPIDDEPLTADDIARMEQGWDAYQRGETISAEEAKRACRGAKDATSRIEADRAVRA